MSNEYQTIKIRRTTYRRLKLLAVQREESMMDCLDRLIDSDTGSDTNGVATDERSPVQRRNTAAERARGNSTPS